MSESFRQQLAATGLQDTAALLRSSSGEIKAVSGQISAMIKPVTEEYRGISASISGELDQLRVASAQLRQHNAAVVCTGAGEFLALAGHVCASAVPSGRAFGASIGEASDYRCA